MSLIDQIGAAITGGSGLPTAKGSIVDQNNSTFYKTNPDNWFIARPYGFRMTFSDTTSHVCFLPISPSNLTISTKFATNMITTLYGTVEEHSDVRYYDIVIEGTTGMVPQYNGVVSNTSTADAYDSMAALNLGRESFSISKSIPLGGFFSKTLGALSQIKNQALTLIDGSNQPNEPAFSNENSGYVAFHTLYKMLLRYKKDASGTNTTNPSGLSSFLGNIKSSVAVNVERKTHPIVFFNYKDGNQYNVVIRDFTMRRSAADPMLYYYSIVMRGYQLQGTEGNVTVNQTDMLKQLGLDGVQGSSFLGDMKKRANAAKGILGATVGGINILGR